MLLEYTGALIYEWFKHECVVERLMDVASRYTRSVFLHPERQDEIIEYLSGWIQLLTYVRKHVRTYIQSDDDWAHVRLELIEERLMDHHEDTTTWLESTFGRLIEWCIAYFEFCRDEYCTGPIVRWNPERQLAACQRFQLFADQVQQNWVTLTTPPSTTPYRAPV